MKKLIAFSTFAVCFAAICVRWFLNNGNTTIYNITIDVPEDHDSERFDISLDVNTKLAANSKTIVLRAIDIQIKEFRCSTSLFANLKCNIVQTGDSLNITRDDGREFTKNTSITFFFTYSAKIHNRTEGFRRLKVDGHSVLYTLLKPESVGKIFPYFEENQQAVCKMTVILHSEELTAISNTDIKNVIRKPNGRVFVFKKTPKIPIHSFMLTVGNFKRIEALMAKNFRVRVHVLNGTDRYKGAFALKIVEKSYAYYSSFLHAFPYKKLDFVAIPNTPYQSFGGIGLVVFNDESILHSIKTVHNKSKRIASGIASEVFKQWFLSFSGPNWIDNGFARFMGMNAIRNINADIDPWPSFLQQESEAFLNPTSLSFLNLGSLSSEDVKTVLVFRMLQSVLSEEKFLNGMRLFYSKSKDRHFDSERLFSFLEKQKSSFNVSSFVNTWLNTKGFPLLAVDSKILSETNLSLLIKQANVYSDKNSTYTIPLFLYYESTNDINAENEHYLTLKAQEFTLNSTEKTLVKINRDRMGLFRVLYEDRMFNSILSQFSSFSANEKVQFLSDSFYYAKHDQMSYLRVFEIVEKCKSARDVVLWETIYDKLFEIERLFTSHENISDGIKKFIVSVSLNLFIQIKSENNSRNIDLSSILARLLVFAEEKAVIDFVSNAESLNRTNIIQSSDLQDLSLLISSNNTTEWKKLQDNYQPNAKMETEVMRALGHIKQPHKVNDILNWAAHNNTALSQIFLVVFEETSIMNPLESWKWLTNDTNWNWIVNTFEPQSELKQILMSSVKFAFGKHSEDAKAFFVAKEKTLSLISSAVEQIKEHLDLNEKWYTTKRKELTDWAEHIK